MMEKIGICTIYTGYNYGSSLQAYAVKYIVNKIGYVPEVFKLSGSLKKGRDIRLNKLFVICIRSLLHYKAGKKNISSYHSSINAIFSDKTIKLFQAFYRNNIAATVIGYRKLKRKSHNDDYVAFICGSDQIWNATAMYIDPFYYLSFAPEYKRIAFAPSLGKDKIPDYNQKIIANKISRIPHLSIREDKGKEIIKDLIGRDPVVLIDPTMVLTKEEWKKEFHLREEDKRYALAYFLDNPSDNATEIIESIRDDGLEILFLPYSAKETDWNGSDVGPIEFIQLILNAEVVLTDSFHGTAFAINFNKKFYSFSRMYGSAENQSSRLLSLLNMLKLTDRFDPKVSNIYSEIDYQEVNKILSVQRNESYSFLQKAIKEVRENG